MLGASVAVFALLGVALLAGHLGQGLFRRARVSDILFLILVGVLVGPLLGLFDPSAIAPAMPILAPLGLVIILFEGGLELRWDELRKHGAGALGFSLLSWLTAACALTAAAHYALGFSLPLAILFAIAVAPTGIVAVIPLLAQIRAPAKARVWLTVETGLGDLLSAVAVTALASFYVFGGSALTFGSIFTARVVLGTAVGFLGGLAWARALHHLREGRNAYALTLGALLMAYVATEALGGSGFLAALVFGLVVGNAHVIVRSAGVPALASLSERSREHQTEIIFLLRSLYFVFIGMTAGALLVWSSLALAAALAVALFAARALAVAIAARRDPAGRGLLLAVMPRGMATLVLAAIPAAMGVPGTEAFVNAALLSVIGADVATAIGLWAVERRRAGARTPAAGAAMH